MVAVYYLNQRMQDNFSKNQEWRIFRGPADFAEGQIELGISGKYYARSLVLEEVHTGGRKAQLPIWCGPS